MNSFRSSRALSVSALFWCAAVMAAPTAETGKQAARALLALQGDVRPPVAESTRRFLVAEKAALRSLLQPNFDEAVSDAPMPMNGARNRFSVYWVASEKWYSVLERLCLKDPEECAVSVEAKQPLNEARKLFQTVVASSSRSKLRDYALFSQGAVEMLLGDFAASDRSMASVENGSVAQLAAYAGVLRADAAFEKMAYGQSRTHLEAALTREGGTPALAGYAQFRLAWSTFLEGQYASSLQWLRKASSGDSALFGVSAPSFLDFSVFPLLGVDQLSEALSFVDMLPADRRVRVLERLASLEQKRQHWAHAEAFYRRLLTDGRLGAEAPQYAIRLARMAGELRGPFAAAQALLDNADSFSPTSEWGRKFDGDARLVQTARNDLDLEVRRFALQAHELAQKKKDLAAYASARGLYEAYLARFSDSADEPTVRFYLAEICYEQGAYELAARHFDEVAHDADASPRDRVEAALGSIKSLDRILGLRDVAAAAVPKKKGLLLARDADEPVQTPYDDEELQFVARVDAFAAAYPTHPEIAEVLYAGCYVRFRHSDYEKAETTLWTILRQYPKSDSVERAAYLLLDIVNRRKNYEELGAVSSRVLALEAFQRNVGFRARVADILRKSLVQRAFVLEKDGEYRKSAEGYMEFVAGLCSQDVELCEKAMFNAAHNYEKVGAHVRASEVREQALGRFPKGKLRKENLLALAKLYERLGYLPRAAAAFSQFAQSFANDDQAAPALLVAAEYFAGASDLRSAEACFLRVIQKYPSSADEAYERLQALYRKAGSLDPQYQIALEMRRRSQGRPAAHLRYTADAAEILFSAGRSSTQMENEVITLFRQQEKTLRNDPGAVDAAARAYFLRAEQAARTALRNTLSGSPDRLEAEVVKLMKAIEVASSTYRDVLSVGSWQWSLAALYASALLQWNVAKQIEALPAPEGLTAEQTGLYRKGVEKQIVVPLLEQSKNSVLQCLQAARENQNVSGWTARCHALATLVEPARYVAVRTFVVEPIRLAEITLKDDGSQVRRRLRDQEALWPFTTAALFAKTEAATGLDSLPTPAAETEETRALTQWVTPVTMTYHAMSHARDAYIAALNVEPHNTSEERGARAAASLEALRGLVLRQPERATGTIIRSLEQDSDSTAARNLLAIAYANQGEYRAARAVLWSMVANGVSHPVVWNNLAVLSYLEGDEGSARKYWGESERAGSCPEAYANLGWLALRYRQGETASRYLALAKKDLSRDLSIRSGLEIARVQTGDFDAASRLQDLSNDSPNDAVSTLAATFALLDGVGDPVRARRIADRLEAIEKNTGPGEVLDTARAYIALDTIGRAQVRSVGRLPESKLSAAPDKESPKREPASAKKR